MSLRYFVKYFFFKIAMFERHAKQTTTTKLSRLKHKHSADKTFVQ